MRKNLRMFYLLSRLIQNLYFKKAGTCHSNPEKSSTMRVNKYIACVYSLFMRCSFDSNENKRHYYRSKNGIKTFINI